jgi:anti-sigma regulatory factor (Ser/Thr protein kinase)
VESFESFESFESVPVGVARAEGVWGARDEGERRAWIVLASESSSLSIARCFVSSMLELWDYEDPNEIVPLLTSEIVSNAVRHAAGRVGLELALLDDEALRVQARDESPETPVIRRSSPDGIGGHGLTIIDTLARRWGVERHDGSKVVWFETPVSPRSRSTPRVRRRNASGCPSGMPARVVRDPVPLQK